MGGLASYADNIDDIKYRFKFTTSMFRYNDEFNIILFHEIEMFFMCA
jgi:hypothetical protein